MISAADLEVICQYVHRVAVAVSRSRGYPSHLVEDLAQTCVESFLSFDLERMDAERPLPTRLRWARRRVFWTIGDFFRALPRDKPEDTDVLEAISDKRGPNPDELAERALRERLIASAWGHLHELPRHQREAVTVSLERGCRALALERGVATSTITRRRDAGLTHLRAQLEATYGDA